MTLDELERIPASDKRIEHHRKDPKFQSVIILHRGGQKDEVIVEGFNSDQTEYTWIEVFRGMKSVYIFKKDLQIPHLGILDMKYIENIRGVTRLGFYRLSLC